MNKVITIHLNGTAYQLEEAGYDALRAYLDNAARQLAGNPDRDEILADIEQAIADKCRALLTGYRTVILAREIEQIIAEMGPVDASAAGVETGPAGAAGPAAGATAGEGSPRPRDGRTAGETGPGSVRRVYRIYEGAVISGVCNGLAAYFGIDPVIVRLVFIMLAFVTFGGMILAYFVLVVLLPVANTPAEKAAAQGVPATAQEFIRRAREGYYDAARAFGKRHVHREWSRRFRREMRLWRRNFRREWQRQAPAWQAGSSSEWMHHPGAWNGLWFTLTFLAVITGLLTVAWIYTLVMLVSHGSVFGLALPAGMPLWVGILLLCVIFSAISWPFRAAKHSLRHHGWGAPPYGAGPALFGFLDGLIGLAVLVLALWLADRYVPQFHEVLVHLPQWIRSFADTVKDWWAHQHT